MIATEDELGRGPSQEDSSRPAEPWYGDQFVNLSKCKEQPTGEEPIGTFVTFQDLLPVISVISDKNQTKTEMYQDHIFIRDDQIAESSLAPPLPLNESSRSVF